MLRKTEKPKGCLAKIGQIVLVIVVLVAIAGGVGVLYQQSSMAQDRLEYVSNGDLIEVDGVEMHLRCTGVGSPTVVFESGAGTPYLNWWAIQEAISQDVRTCVYDRQNIGWSAYTGDIPTPEFTAHTLHTLLTNAGEAAPYVMVGHSLGGVYVRKYTELYPDDVAGMVLIDSSHEQQQARLPQAYATLASAEQPILNLCRILAPTGILRVLNMGAESVQSSKGSPVYEEEVALFNQSHFCAGVRADLAGIQNLSTSTPPNSLGNLPLAVLTAGVKQSDNPESFPENFSLELLQQADHIWLELQEELVTLSTNSVWIVVEDATHYIHLDQPHVVINAIRDILAQATIS